MVKFVASVGVNISQLQGLQKLLDGNYSVKGVPTDTKITLKAGAIKFKLTGHDFGVDLGTGDLTGTVTGIVAKAGGDPLYSATKFSLDISDIADGTSLSGFVKDLFSGKDTLIGSSDDDILRGFGGGDRILGKNGKDTLIGDSGGDNLQGGNKADTLKGGKGGDKLDGGKGSDILNGGKGLDQYIFKDAPGHGVDTITNFQAGETIKVDNNDFPGIGGKGVLNADFFVQAHNAQDSNDFFVYRKGQGKILFDHDGAGGDKAILFAKVDPHTSLDHNDFLVI